MISDKMKAFVNSVLQSVPCLKRVRRLAEIYGAENVYDFSLGNPSVPASVRD